MDFLIKPFLHMYSLTPASAVEVIKTEPSVCVSVCVCVCQLALSQLNRSAYGHEIWYRD